MFLWRLRLWIEEIYIGSWNMRKFEKFQENRGMNEINCLLTWNVSLCYSR